MTVILSRFVIFRLFGNRLLYKMKGTPNNEEF